MLSSLGFLELEIMLWAEPQDVSNNLKCVILWSREYRSKSRNLIVKSENAYFGSGNFIQLFPLSPHLFTPKTF